MSLALVVCGPGSPNRSGFTNSGALQRVSSLASSIHATREDSG